MLLSNAETTFTHLHAQLNPAPDLSGHAKTIEGLWRFICHINVFLGQVPAWGEPRYSGQDIAVYSASNNSSCSTSLRAFVCIHKKGGREIKQLR